MSEQKISPSQRLAEFTNEMDNVFNHLFGYVIAFTSLVAFADVLGNGEITQYLPGLYWVWVIAQGLCVEFQVFILIRRMPGYWTHNRKLFWIYITFISALCIMSILIGSIFVQHDNAHGTIEQAMGALGIPHIGFIYARSALAILLVTLIAIDRALAHHAQQVDTPNTPDVLAIFEQKLTSLATAEAEARAAMLDVIQQQMNTAVITMEEQTQKLLAMPKVSTPRIVDGDTDEKPAQGTRSKHTPFSVVKSAGMDTYEQQIRGILMRDMAISNRALAKRVGCTPATVKKWRERIQSEQGEMTEVH